MDLLIGVLLLVGDLNYMVVLLVLDLMWEKAFKEILIFVGEVTNGEIVEMMVDLWLEMFLTDFCYDLFVTG